MSAEDDDIMLYEYGMFDALDAAPHKSSSNAANHQTKIDLYQNRFDLSSIPQKLETVTPRNPEPNIHAAARINPPRAMAYLHNNAETDAVLKIEKVFNDIADALVNDSDELLVMLKKRPSAWLLPSAGAVMPEFADRRICFPGKTTKEAWRFSQLTVVVRILELIHEALVTRRVTTKRDMYYKDPALFLKQQVVDRYVNDIAYTFDVPRSSLNVATLIPDVHKDDVIEIDTAHWILVIEKEATFHSLLSSTFWSTMANHGILITGKGYPDIATRSFLQRLSKSSQIRDAPPIYGLVDYDPDGLGIFATYKYGSLTLAHENAALVVPNIHWLGLRSDDVSFACDMAISYSEHEGRPDDVMQSQGLLPLSLRDRKKAISMLEWKHVDQATMDLEWRRELQIMLMLNMKAEIQLLENVDGGLQAWLARKMLPV